MGKLKKRSIKSVEIGFSCTEEWAKMKGSDQKRHCDSCNKSVIDFSIMSEQEIIDYLAKRKKQNTCGRFTEEQLTQLNHNLTLSEPNQLRNFAKSVVVGAMLTVTSSAQAQSCKNTIGRYEIVNHELSDTLSPIYVKGVVLGEDGWPLIGANVYIPSLQKGTTADINGKFELEINEDPSESLRLSFNYVGFKGYDIKLADINNKEIKAVLAEGNWTTGEIVIEPDTWYERFVNGIIRPLR